MKAQCQMRKENGHYKGSDDIGVHMKAKN